MRIICEYSDHEGVGFNPHTIEKIVAETILFSRYKKNLVGKEITISVATISKQEMCRVNATYRDKDAVTDVISVGEYSDTLAIEEVSEVSLFLGEVLVCWDFIQKSATIHNVEADYEFGYVLSHGVLHLLGYAHGEEMFALQHRISTDFSPSLR